MGGRRVNAEQMYERDNGSCLACGRVDRLTTQHRHNRGAGGVHRAGEAESERPSNRITLCFGCNEALERDARFARTGRDMGWKLVEGEDPAAVAVYHVWFREWRLLDDDGSYTVTSGRDPDPDAAAVRAWAA